MLPKELWRSSFRLEGERIVPRYLGSRDLPWLTELLSEHARSSGQKRSALRERLLAVPAPRAKLRMACHVLDFLSRDRTTAAVPPREARWLAFRLAAGGNAPRAAVLQQAARTLDVSSVELEAALFADLRSERRVCELPESLGPERLAIETNLAIVRSFLLRAASVRITASGEARALVRQARLAGLICNVSQVGRGGPQILDISGPFALFRHTGAYGRALGKLVAHAAACCPSFVLTAGCALGAGSERSSLTVSSDDPIGLGLEPPLGERAVERHFIRDFRGAAPEWQLIFEPPPIEAQGTLIFPDFELTHPRDSERSWFVEIAGYWTREYLEGKLARLSEAGLDRFLICVDDDRLCAVDEPPVHARVVRYERRIDPRLVLEIMTGASAAHSR